MVLFDLDGQLIWHDPAEPAMEAMLAQVVEALGVTGFNPHTGRSLYRLARSAGLTELTVRVEPNHLIVGRVNERERARWALKLDVARPAITHAVGSAEQAGRAIETFMRFLENEDSLTYSVSFTVTGRVPLATTTAAAAANTDTMDR
ncbi:hypothetical protein AB0I82_13805 [Streptomyces sp. NPDC050315]|uniref:hypothetical protein n=1 Tax=Streptomyces sp. NPDC050315 TaxID=3155039 RepID=UPI003445660B